MLAATPNQGPPLWGAVLTALIGIGAGAVGWLLLAKRKQRQAGHERWPLFGRGVARGNRSETYTTMVYVWGPLTLIAFGAVIFVTGVIWMF